MNYGIGNVKSKSGEIIANNGAYFVDLTNATESSGVYTIPSADIENGDFTLQVGDTLIDKDSGSMLKIATLTPSITASLVFEASGGGGKQLYQHNIFLIDTSVSANILFTIVNEQSTAMTWTDIKTYLSSLGTSYKNSLKATGHLTDGGVSNEIYGVYVNNTNDFKAFGYGNGYMTYTSINYTSINDTIIPK